MRRISIVLMTMILVFGLLISSHAVLIDRGGGMIYSTDMDVTWLQDAKYARTSWYDLDGLMDWYEAMEWAANLEYAGYNDWRLPTFDPINQSQCDVSLLHEMRYLLYSELGNDCMSMGYDYGPFINASTPAYPTYVYWTGTEVDQDTAWNFYLDCG